jgi:transcription antitermination factor NusG
VYHGVSVREPEPQSSSPAGGGLPEAGLAWYALYTRSRHEKRVAACIEERGFQVYLPLVPRERQWHDRLKTIEWPMFPGYVFARFDPRDRVPVISAPGVVHLVGVAGQPARIPEADVDNVRRFAAALADTGEVPAAEPIVDTGERVRVVRGPFKDVRGVVVESRSSRRALVQVGLKAIGRGLKVEVPVADLEHLVDA